MSAWRYTSVSWNGLNIFKCEISRIFETLTPPVIALSCWCVSFTPPFVLQLLNSPSLISPQCSSLSLTLLSFSPWALTPPPSSVIVCHRKRSLPPASAITQNPSSSVAFDFFQMCHVLTSTFLHILFPNSQVALCSFLSFLLWFHCGAWTLVHVAPVVLSFFSSHSGHSCLEAYHHYQSSSCFFIIFTLKSSYMVSFLISIAWIPGHFSHQILEHHTIFIVERKYIGSLRWSCGD